MQNSVLLLGVCICFLSSMISLNKALEMMRRKDERGRFVPFSITFVGCNFSKKTGGELITYNNVTLPQRERVELETTERRYRDVIALPDEGSHGTPLKGKPDYSKTTVMFRTDGEEFRQAHIHLITRYNGETVI